MQVAFSETKKLISGLLWGKVNSFSKLSYNSSLDSEKDP